MQQSPFRIAVFASGAGTTLQTLIDSQKSHDFKVSLVVSNRQCTALERAEANNIPTLLTKDWQEIDNVLNNKEIQLVVLAGFLAIIPRWVCANWDCKIINIHT